MRVEGRVSRPIFEIFPTTTSILVCCLFGLCINAGSVSLVSLKQLTKVAPKSQNILAATVPSKGEAGCAVLTKPFQFNDSLITANSISVVNEHQEISCLVANVGPTTITISANKQIGCYETVESPELTVANGSMDKVAGVSQLSNNDTVNIGDDLNEDQIEDLRYLFQKHIEAFPINSHLGKTSVATHDIELLPDTKPVAERLRRRPYAHKEEAKKQIAKMLEDGIIEPSDSPWAAAYVLVRKKTGDMRLCIDFRKLNYQTRKDVYPLPNVGDCLEPLAGNEYYSQLDLAAGYWRIAMSDGAKDKTAFRTEDGHFQFCRMPFGLTNAPASFQRLVNALFSGPVRKLQAGKL